MEFLRTPDASVWAPRVSSSASAIASVSTPGTAAGGGAAGAHGIDRAGIKSSFQTLFTPNLNSAPSTTTSALPTRNVSGLTPFLSGGATPNLVTPALGALAPSPTSAGAQGRDGVASTDALLASPYLQAAAKEAVRREFMSMPAFMGAPTPDISAVVTTTVDDDSRARPAPVPRSALAFDHLASSPQHATPTSRRVVYARDGALVPASATRAASEQHQQHPLENAKKIHPNSTQSASASESQTSPATSLHSSASARSAHSRPLTSSSSAPTMPSSSSALQSTAQSTGQQQQREQQQQQQQQTQQQQKQTQPNQTQHTHTQFAVPPSAVPSGTRPFFAAAPGPHAPPPPHAGVYVVGPQGAPVLMPTTAMQPQMHPGHAHAHAHAHAHGQPLFMAPNGMLMIASTATPATHTLLPHPPAPPGVVLHAGMPAHVATSANAGNGNVKTESAQERKDRIEREKQELIREFKKKTREAALVRFRQKRRERRFGKLIRYDCRKKLADARPRVKGRFVRVKTGEEESQADDESAQVVPSLGE